jgi:hypothetical protein
MSANEDEPLAIKHCQTAADRINNSIPSVKRPPITISPLSDVYFGILK